MVIFRLIKALPSVPEMGRCRHRHAALHASYAFSRRVDGRLGRGRGAPGIQTPGRTKAPAKAAARPLPPRSNCASSRSRRLRNAFGAYIGSLCSQEPRLAWRHFFSAHLRSFLRKTIRSSIASADRVFPQPGMSSDLWTASPPFGDREPTGARGPEYMPKERIFGYPDHYVQSSERHPMDHLSAVVGRPRPGQGDAGRRDGQLLLLGCCPRARRPDSPRRAPATSASTSPARSSRCRRSTASSRTTAPAMRSASHSRPIGASGP